MILRTFSTVIALVLTSLLVVAGCDPAPEDGAGDASNEGEGEGEEGGVGPHGDVVDPACIDGKFSEVLPDPTVDIGDLVAAYNPAAAAAFVTGVLERRYPFGAALFALGENQASSPCLEAFGYDLSTAAKVLGNLTTIVHECGHFADGDASAFPSNAYFINTNLKLEAAQGDTTQRGGLTFARNLIRNDAFSQAHPPCNGTFGAGCDFYADTYLDGDATNQTFEGGDQGFNMLFEEVVQYVNSLAVAYATQELFTQGAQSNRDGILNLLWFLERYLVMARTQYPSAYDHIVNGDAGAWRKGILTVWGRAWLYLETTAGLPGMGIQDDLLEGLVTDPVLVQEIERLRVAEGC